MMLLCGGGHHAAGGAPGALQGAIASSRVARTRATRNAFINHFGEDQFDEEIWASTDPEEFHRRRRGEEQKQQEQEQQPQPQEPQQEEQQQQQQQQQQPQEQRRRGVHSEDGNGDDIHWFRPHRMRGDAITVNVKLFLGDGPTITHAIKFGSRERLGEVFAWYWDQILLSDSPSVPTTTPPLTREGLSFVLHGDHELDLRSTAEEECMGTDDEILVANPHESLLILVQGSEGTETLYRMKRSREPGSVFRITLL